MFKKIFLFFFLTILISPTLVLAEGSTDSKVPELNPLCWQKSKCAEVRKEYFSITDISNPDSWCVRELPCDGKVNGGDGNDYWCKCLPAGQTNTAIKIGGTNTFSNLGVYVITVYDYVLKVAGIVAVIVIIVAGVQWLTSGGNGSIIESAKKRLLGAFIGLFIAYGSYFILNTINPALVNFRLPQTWMLKPYTLAPNFCKDLDSGIKLAYAGNSESNIQKTDIKGKTFDLESGKSKLDCNKEYFIDGSNGSTCQGNYCKSDSVDTQMCLVNLDSKDFKNPNYYCGRANLAGFISASGQWAKNIAANSSDNYQGMQNREVGLVTVCNDGLVYLDENATYTFVPNLKDGSAAYSIIYNTKDIMNAEENICKSNKGFKGFALVINFEGDGKIYNHNESHVIGKGGLDLGTYMIAPQTYKLFLDGMNIWMPGTYILGLFGIDTSSKANCGYFTFFSPGYDKKYFFTANELIKGEYMNISSGAIRVTGDGATYIGGDKINSIYSKYTNTSQVNPNCK